MGDSGASDADECASCLRDGNESGAMGESDSQKNEKSMVSLDESYS
jgi:ubiquitin